MLVCGGGGDAVVKGVCKTEKRRCLRVCCNAEEVEESRIHLDGGGSDVL